ncbi:MAG: exodeoxyribonuclease III [bacterium]
MRLWKIASFNINSIRARLPALVDWLHVNRPDVLCIQETKVSDKEFPAEKIREAGYQVVHRGEPSYNGVAIISITPPDEVKYGLGGKEPDESRLIYASIDGVPIVNTYVPQGRHPDSPHFQYKLKWFDRLLSYFKKNHSPDMPLIWTGDLNIAPEDIDVHNPKRLRGHVDFHPEVQARFEKIMNWGFVDVFRKHVPNPGQYTFFDYRVKGALDKGLGWRVDHILATSALAHCSAKAWIDLKPRKGNKPSDHAPIVAEFDLDRL